MLEIIWIIVIGAVIGVLAKFLMPGRDPGGIFITAMLGMVGSITATLLGRFAGCYASGEGAGFIASVLGAILVLFIYRRTAARP